jgi:voltage-gated potassium channel
VLSARELNPRLHIVARAETKETVPKLVRAGADRTLSPYEVGGKRLARLAMHPFIADYLDIITRGEEGIQFRLEEFEVGEDSPLVNHTFRELRVAEEGTGARILAVRHPDNTFNTNPSPEDRVLAGDVLIVLGTRDQVARLERLVQNQ